MPCGKQYQLCEYGRPRLRFQASYDLRGAFFEGLTFLLKKTMILDENAKNITDSIVFNFYCYQSGFRESSIFSIRVSVLNTCYIAICS
jgi:hypothetical protein